MNITDDQLETLRSQLATCKLGHGLGTVDEPCSVAAINLALSGELSDRDPSECMSHARLRAESEARHYRSA